MEFLYSYTYFIIYAFLGWLCEDIYCGIGKRKFINRGFLYGPYCPIYGFGALMVIYPLLMLGNHPVYVFIAGMFITSVLEYITSYLMEKMFSTRWWDYSTYPMNINGRVCLQNSLLFGLLSLVVVYGIHPIIRRFVSMISIDVLSILLVVFTVFFTIDLWFTVVALLKRKQVFKHLQEDVDRLKVEFERNRGTINEELEQWVQEHAQNSVILERIRKRVDMIEEIRKKHILKAFPDRIMADSLKQLEEFAKKLNNK